MACACKRNQKNKGTKITDLNHRAEKKGFMYFLNASFDWLTLMFFGRIFMAIFIFCVVIILLPLICISLIITQLYEGRARVIVPKSFMSKINKIGKKVQNNE